MVTLSNTLKAQSQHFNFKSLFRFYNTEHILWLFYTCLPIKRLSVVKPLLATEHCVQIWHCGYQSGRQWSKHKYLHSYIVKSCHVTIQGYCLISDLDELCSLHEDNWKRKKKTLLHLLHPAQYEKVLIHQLSQRLSYSINFYHYCNSASWVSYTIKDHSWNKLKNI